MLDACTSRAGATHRRNEVAIQRQRFQRLDRWTDWVENLALDLSWLPDGAAILARLLFDKQSSSDRALELAIGASRRRMLYTESYSLLLDLFRRWPKEASSQVKDVALCFMAHQAPYIDWESTCLSISGVEVGE